MQLSCNSHAITGNRMEPLGLGLYLVISIINHRYAGRQYNILSCLILLDFSPYALYTILVLQLLTQFCFGI